MKQEVLESYHQLAAVESERIERQLQRDLASTLSMLSRNGVLQGSAGMNAVVGVATKAIPVEAQVAFTILLRVLNAHGELIKPENKHEAKSILLERIDQRSGEIKALIKETPPFKSPHANDAFLEEFENTVSQETRRISAEIDLIAAANTAKNPATPRAESHTFNFNAPVGVVQTGDGSYGVAHQHIDAGSREQIEKALQKVLEAAHSFQGEISEDIVELIVDAKSEAEKERPNPSKLKALVSGVGSAISNAPKLRDAYDTLKWAAVFIGINLP